MKRKLIYLSVILSGLVLGGCETLGGFYDVLFTRGAEFYDDALQGAIDIKCKALSGGAMQRRYMQTPETWKLWTGECLRTRGQAIPALPPTLEVN